MEFDEKTVNLIRERSLQMEREGTLQSEVLQYIYDQGWFKLFVPQSLGGKLTSLPDALKIIEYASWIDGSFGWLTSIGSGGGYFATYMNREVAVDVFSSPHAVIAGSGYPSGIAVRTEGGYIVSGEWKYCSGSTHATIFTGNCMIQGDDSSNPEVRAFIFLPDQVKVIKDWNAFGLKATASHTISVQNQFVPYERTFNLLEKVSFHDDPLYDFPFLQFAESTFAAITLGIARHFLDEALSLALRHKDNWNRGNEQRYDFVIKRINEMEQQLKVGNKSFYKHINRAWNDHIKGEHLSQSTLNDISHICKLTSQVALACGQKVFPYLGTSVIMEHTAVNHVWRDLQTACQHAMLVPFYELNQMFEKK